MKQKGQAALEFLMTYGWALIAIVVAVLAMFELGIFTYHGHNAAGFNVAVMDFRLTEPAGAQTIDLVIGNSTGQRIDINSINVEGVIATFSPLERIAPNKQKTITAILSPTPVPGSYKDPYTADVTLDYSSANGLRHYDSGTLQGLLEESSAFIVGTLTSGDDWVEHSGNPVLDPPAGRAYYPTVLYDNSQFSGHGAAAYYKAWYSTGSNIALATSANGINWSVGVDSNGLTSPHHAKILYDASGFGGSKYYKIWYWDTSNSIYDINAIRYAESTDGLNWVNDQPVTGNLLSNTHPLLWNRGTYGPLFLFYNASATNTGSNPFDYSYAMYYDGTTGGLEFIGLAYSSNGINWTRYGNDPVLSPSDPTQWNAPGTGDWETNYASYASVMKDGSTWHMWYSGGQGAVHEGIGHATSTDGLSWKKDPANPYFTIGGAGWRSQRGYTPSVLYSVTNFDGHGTSTKYKMWVSGKDGGGNYAIGYFYNWAHSAFAKFANPTTPSNLRAVAQTVIHSTMNVTVKGTDATDATLTGTVTVTSGTAGRTFLVNAVSPFKTVTDVGQTGGTSGDKIRIEVNS